MMICIHFTKMMKKQVPAKIRVPNWKMEPKITWVQLVMTQVPKKKMKEPKEKLRDLTRALVAKRGLLRKIQANNNKSMSLNKPPQLRQVKPRREPPEARLLLASKLLKMEVQASHRLWCSLLKQSQNQETNRKRKEVKAAKRKRPKNKPTRKLKT